MHRDDFDNLVKLLVAVIKKLDAKTVKYYAKDNMPLTFFNTYSRRKEEFKPLEPGHVRMYTCGPPSTLRRI
jgi:hypothetical protein